MAVLDTLKPEKVFAFFEEISRIPRGSGKTEAIAAFCLDFAKKRNLKAMKDDGGNVVIYAPGTEGYEQSEPLVIQGHMDMVCEKIASCKKDMEKEGLDVCTDGEYVWAEGTTLGGDDGIALAYMFALLDSDDIPHPPLECLITRDEETGMFGAKLFDADCIKGRKILNIDSEEEGILTVSCAGGITAHCEFLLPDGLTEPAFSYEISVTGLKGGHSGADIGKGRMNAFNLLCVPLRRIDGCYFGTITGGGKQNVIPNTASVIIGSDEDRLSALEEIVRACNELELGLVDEPDLLFSVKRFDGSQSVKFFEKTDTLGVICEFLRSAPTGVRSMSENIADMVQSSLNLGVLELNGRTLSCDFLVRSNADSDRAVVVEEVRGFVASMREKMEVVGMTLSDDYPAWEYREDSPLRETMASVYREVYGEEPVIAGIHAGLECAVFSAKMKDADLVSIGPNIYDIHTPDERMEVASVVRTWEYVKALLKAMK